MGDANFFSATEFYVMFEGITSRPLLVPKAYAQLIRSSASMPCLSAMVKTLILYTVRDSA